MFWNGLTRGRFLSTCRNYRLASPSVRKRYALVAKVLRCNVEIQIADSQSFGTTAKLSPFKKKTIYVIDPTC
jgi:hypothetical protein